MHSIGTNHNITSIHTSISSGHLDRIGVAFNIDATLRSQDLFFRRKIVIHDLQKLFSLKEQDGVAVSTLPLELSCGSGNLYVPFQNLSRKQGYREGLSICMTVGSISCRLCGCQNILVHAHLVHDAKRMRHQTNTCTPIESDFRAFLENYIIDTSTVECVGHRKTRHTPSDNDDFERRWHFGNVLAAQ
jgi:hypothetical protein